jgi:hypothetical protein
MALGKMSENAIVDETEVFPVDIIPPWYSMLIYHLGDEEQARWSLQLGDVVFTPST